MDNKDRTTFQVLNNFPQDLQQRLIDIWHEQDWEVEKDVFEGKFFHYGLRKDHPIYQEFPGAYVIEYYEVVPGFSNSPHLDRGRWAAINAPIIVDFENSFFYCGKYFYLGNYTPNAERMEEGYKHEVQNKKGPVGFFEKEWEKMYKYNLEKPVLFSSKVPHGGNNKNGKFNRVIASISYVDYTYEQVINALPPEWY